MSKYEAKNMNKALKHSLDKYASQSKTGLAPYLTAVSSYESDYYVKLVRCVPWPEGAPHPDTVPHAGTVVFDAEGFQYDVVNGIPEFNSICKHWQLRVITIDEHNGQFFRTSIPIDDILIEAPRIAWSAEEIHEVANDLYISSGDRAGINFIRELRKRYPNIRNQDK